MKQIYLVLLLLLTIIAKGQLPYTNNNFSVTVETDISYGISENYAGQSDTLLMDIYKPVGDDNCIRPCLVLVHGGSWIAGSKSDANIVTMANSFAAKGWVVATVNYRLGTHKTNSYSMYALCNTSLSAPCGYICDSAEVFRAIYRGQQDVKGAIRFLKSRENNDSTDINNYFVAGESAGAYIAYATAFMDQSNEKPTFCGAISDAPTPDPDLINCLPVGYSLARPDLGDINGTLHLGTYNSTVEGVGGFYGGMLNFEMIQGDTQWPAVYMFHQGSDVIVNYNYGRILGRMDWECYSQSNICQNYAKYPKSHGSKSIETYFSGLTNAPVRKVDIIENYEYLNDCFDNGHSITNLYARIDSMAHLFAERIASNGNSPSTGPCVLSTEMEYTASKGLIYPNPTNTGFQFVNTKIGDYANIYSTEGKLVKNVLITENEQYYLDKGIYIVQVFFANENKIETIKLIVE